MHEQKEQLDKWADMWDKSLANGTFDDAPGPPTPPSQTADVSYFGLVNTHPTDDINDVDTQYWNNLCSNSTSYVDPLEAAMPSVIQEANGTVPPKEVGKLAEPIINSPNPIRPASVGKDQDMGKGSLGVTYTPEEIEELAELKKKVHSLQDQMNTADGMGKKSSQYDAKIQAIKEKIDALSDDLTQAYDTAIGSQGD